MKDRQSQSPVKWDCKCHVVILPKYRREVLYGGIRRGAGQILRDLCRRKDIGLVGGRRCSATWTRVSWTAISLTAPSRCLPQTTDTAGGF